ncbi:MAG: putative Ig domain-containing protein, partial [Bryobacteraceae bacterium]
SGGTPPYRWSGTVAAGLTLTDEGLIAGSPAASGSFTLPVTVTDSASRTAARSFTLSIDPPGLSITTTSPLPSGTVGTVYSQTLSATGGTPPYQWSGSAPPGLSLGANGAITGTPSAAGSFNVTATVTDNASLAATRNFSITIDPPGLSITTTPPLPAGTVGTMYSQTLSATGGTPPYQWSGSAPAGLTLGSDGAITGTPSAAGSFSLIATVTDGASFTANRTFAITINSPMLSIITTSLPAGTVGTAYSQSLSASGGTPPYQWSGALPAGLSLSSVGAITGTPSAPGSFNLTTTVTDGASLTADRTFTINIAPLTLTISTTSPLPAGTLNTAYLQSLSASGGTPPYRWSGTAPAGLTLGSDGSITGVPSTTGGFTFAATVTDGASLTANRTFALTINSPTLTISSPMALPTATVGTAYIHSLAASGGVPPYRWVGLAPSGLSLSSDGAITGTPSTAGTFSFAAQVSDSAFAQASRLFTIVVAAGASPLTITTAATLSSATVRTPYSQPLVASGGRLPYSWTVISGTLPSGIRLNPDGLLAGTATTAGESGFTVQVTDSASASVSKRFGLSVTSGLTIPTPPTLPPGSVGAAYSQSLSVVGGVAPFQWSIIAGALPGGLSIDCSTGIISGVPASAGTFNFTVQASDRTAAIATKQVTLSVAGELAITTAPILSTGSLGAPYLQQLLASGGVPPVTWSISAGQLPPGLTLDSSTGLISGIVNGAGLFDFTVLASDSASHRISKRFTIAVATGLTISTAPELPGGTSGAAYDLTLVAGGGRSPYVWSISSGSLPPGIALDPASGRLSGAPTTSGQASFTVQVSDSNSVLARKQLTVVISARLTIAPIPSVNPLAGTLFTLTLTANGGTPPFAWSLAEGSLPDGLTLDASSGVIGGIPTSGGSFSFSIQVSDAAGASSSRPFALNVETPPMPVLSVSSLPEVAEAAQQVLVDVSLGGTYPLPIEGSATMRFVPDPAAGANDPAIQFSAGGRSVNFVIPANSVRPSPQIALQTGTVAGTIELNVKAQGQPDLNRSIAIRRSVPAIRNLRAVRDSAGFELRLTGFSTSREVTQATVSFSGAGLQTTELVVPLTELSVRWYQSSASTPFGSQFALVLPFTVRGEPNAVRSATVTIHNAQGASSAARIDF